MTTVVESTRLEGRRGYVTVRHVESSELREYGPKLLDPPTPANLDAVALVIAGKHETWAARQELNDAGQKVRNEEELPASYTYATKLEADTALWEYLDAQLDLLPREQDYTGIHKTGKEWRRLTQNRKRNISGLTNPEVTALDNALIDLANGVQAIRDLR